MTIIEQTFYALLYTLRRPLMISVLEFLTSFYWMAIPETILQTLWHADWRSAKNRGLGGLLSEAIGSLLGTNTWPFFVRLDSGWNAADIAHLLKRHGIRTWGYGFANGELFFRVRKSQAAWAQYVLLRKGVPLEHRLFSEKKTSRPQPIAGLTLGQRLRQKEAPASLTGYLESIVDSVDNHLTSLTERVGSLF
jgi:hypothetical protein